MPKAGLQRAGVVSAISEAITAGVPKHVLGCAQTDDFSGLAAFESLPFSRQSAIAPPKLWCHVLLLPFSLCVRQQRDARRRSEEGYEFASFHVGTFADG